MNKEDLQVEYDLLNTASYVFDNVKPLEITQDLKDKILLLAETVMEDTNKNIKKHFDKVKK